MREILKSIKRRLIKKKKGQSDSKNNHSSETE